MAKDDKKKGKGHDHVVDLSARIGARQPPPVGGAEVPTPVSPPPDEPPATRIDAPIPSAPKRLIPAKEDRQQGAMIQKALADESKPQPAIPSPRTVPGPGEIDLVVTPLPTPDDWHRFELALRKVRGVGQLRTEYYRHGVLKVRVNYQGADRLAAALRTGLIGYRVRVIGEDRVTLQILVTSEGDERRPG
jgi:hypothetical protein